MDVVHPDTIMKTTVTLLIFLVCSTCYAQPDTLWARNYQNYPLDICYSLSRTDSGDYLLAGQTYSEENRQEYGFAKATAEGDSCWFISLGGTGRDVAYVGFQTLDGNYLVAGVSSSFSGVQGRYETWIVKLSQDGDSLWSHRNPVYFTGPASGLSCQDSGFVISGSAGSTVYLFKHALDGEILWQRTFDFENSVCATNIYRTLDNGYVFSGAGGVAGRSFDAFILKTDSLGHEEWRRFYGTEYFDSAKDIALLPDGGYLLAGNREHLGSDWWEFFAIRVDSDGEQVWDRSYWRGHDDFCEAVTVSLNDGFVLAGRERRGVQPPGILLRIDSNGEEIWRALYDWDCWVYFNDILTLDDGSYAVAGRAELYSPSESFLLMRTTPDPADVPRLIDPAFPSFYSFEPPYPNPFNSSCCFVYQVPEPEHVNVSVFDLTGRLVETLVDDPVKPGSYKLVWSAQHRPSGVYFCRLKAGGYTGAIKLNLVR